MSGFASTPTRGPWFANAIASVDQYGRKAWIALMVITFIVGGPLGLVVLAYILGTGRLKRASYPQNATGSCSFRTRDTMHHMSRSTGNAAFDHYKADTIARLEREQAEFEAFLIRLRESRDKAEFDQYLDERAKEADLTGDDDNGQSAEKPARGAY
jgi:hypothetical protein